MHQHRGHSRRVTLTQHEPNSVLHPGGWLRFKAPSIAPQQNTDAQDHRGISLPCPLGLTPHWWLSPKCLNAARMQGDALREVHECTHACATVVTYLDATHTLGDVKEHSVGVTEGGRVWSPDYGSNGNEMYSPVPVANMNDGQSCADMKRAHYRVLFGGSVAGA